MNTSQQPEVKFGNSAKTQKLLAQMRRVAVTDVPVLLFERERYGQEPCCPRHSGTQPTT